MAAILATVGFIAATGSWNRPARAANPTTVALPAVVRGNAWHLRKSLTSGVADVSFTYGDLHDIPVFGDWDGDGNATPGVIRGNTWLLRNENSSGVADIVLSFGLVGDVPVVGDWDGDGDDTPGVVRGNVWFLRNETSTGPGEISFTYGNNTDRPIVGDWNGDGTSNPGVAREGDPGCIDCPDQWLVRTSNTTGSSDVFPISGGAANPVPGDWDGNATATAGYVEGGLWHYRNGNESPTPTFHFGLPSDIPLAWSVTV